MFKFPVEIPGCHIKEIIGIHESYSVDKRISFDLLMLYFFPPLFYRIYNLRRLGYIFDDIDHENIRRND